MGTTARGICSANVFRSLLVSGKGGDRDPGARVLLHQPGHHGHQLRVQLLDDVLQLRRPVVVVLPLIRPETVALILLGSSVARRVGVVMYPRLPRESQVMGHLDVLPSPVVVALAGIVQGHSEEVLPGRGECLRIERASRPIPVAVQRGLQVPHSPERHEQQGKEAGRVQVRQLGVEAPTHIHQDWPAPALGDVRGAVVLVPGEQVRPPRHAGGAPQQAVGGHSLMEGQVLQGQRSVHVPVEGAVGMSVGPSAHGGPKPTPAPPIPGLTHIDARTNQRSPHRFPGP
jgi:hypothetical protein